MDVKLCILRCPNMSLRIRGRSSCVVFMGERVKWGGHLKKLCKNIFKKKPHPLSFSVSTTTSISYLILLYFIVFYVFIYLYCEPTVKNKLVYLQWYKTFQKHLNFLCNFFFVCFCPSKTNNIYDFHFPHFSHLQSHPAGRIETFCGPFLSHAPFVWQPCSKWFMHQ